MASITTGSCVNGLVCGMRNHLGGGAAIMYVLSPPDGIVTPAVAGTAADSGVSGNVIAYDSANNQFYQSTTGSTWVKLGSVA